MKEGNRKRAVFFLISVIVLCSFLLFYRTTGDVVSYDPSNPGFIIRTHNNFDWVNTGKIIVYFSTAFLAILMVVIGINHSIIKRKRKLDEFIERNLSRGHSKDRVRHHLVSHGLKEKEVDRALIKF